MGWKLLLTFVTSSIIAAVGVIPGKTYEIIPPTQEVLSNEAVLRLIAICESGDRHLDENGYTLRGRANPNDIGRFQINLIHQPEALKMGLDIFQDADNRLFAEHLLKTQGLKPWVFSKRCWSPLIGSSTLAISG